MTTTKEDVQAAEAVFAEVQRPHERQPLGSPPVARQPPVHASPRCGTPCRTDQRSACPAVPWEQPSVPSRPTRMLPKPWRRPAPLRSNWEPGRDVLDGAASAETQTAATQAPQPTAEPLDGEALVERKRLAGASRSQEPGTTFGSRWTAEEREALQQLFHEHGRRAAAAQFVAAHPHRTIDGPSTKSTVTSPSGRSRGNRDRGDEGSGDEAPACAAARRPKRSGGFLTCGLVET